MWYGSRTSADCQPKLFSSKLDTSGRFTLVTSLEEQERDDGTWRQIAGLNTVETALKSFLR